MTTVWISKTSVGCYLPVGRLALTQYDPFERLSGEGSGLLELSSSSPNQLQPRINLFSSQQCRLARLALILACTIWGTSFVFGKIALQELTVSQVVLFRFGMASLALLPVALIRRATLDPRDLPNFLGTGFLAVPGTFLLQFHGLSLTSIARASLIIGAIPPLLAFGAVIFLRERPGWRAWGVIAVSSLGVALIVGFPGGQGSMAGDMLVFLSTLVSVIWVLRNKRLSEKYGPLAATAYLLLFGTLTLIPFTLLRDGIPSLALTFSTWISLAALGFLCSGLAFVLWNWGLERVSASTAGVYLNLEPLVGAFLGVTLWHESMGTGLILGGTLILGSAILVARWHQSSSHHAQGVVSCG